MFVFENETYKFIKVDGGEYEFCKVTPFCKSHKEMAAGRKVEAAGLISIWGKEGKEVRLDDSWSSTLNIGCQDKHLEEIAKLHGLTIRDKWK